MSNTLKKLAVLATTSLVAGGAAAGPVYQPPGANLTIGDVTHGLRVQSASSNPAAAAADVYRNDGKSTRGTVLSLAAGIEYGNVQELFDLFDGITGGYQPSPPGTSQPGPGQGTDPDRGIDINEILDAIDPELRPIIDAAANEIAAQAAVLGIIAAEGYGRAWVTGDLPFVLGGNWLGGTWTTGLNWSGTSKAFGIVDPLDFDVDEALGRLEEWLDDANPPEFFQLSGDVLIRISPNSGNVRLLLDNDSTILTKAAQVLEFDVGYSRQISATTSGGLFVGAELNLYQVELSNFAARFGDITDSEALFDAIDNADFNTNYGAGLDLGLLYVANNYQIGAQWTNINAPEFDYPEVDTSTFRNEDILNRLQQESVYVMDDQIRLEGSLFTTDRKWSTHLGIDANAARDPMGDEYQWATLSGAWTPNNFWVTNLRLGWRQNLAGTELGYASVGATVFRYVNFDVSSALDTVKISGTELPQGLMASLGFSIHW